MEHNTENQTKLNEKTTILLYGKTREKLKSLGKKGETYDEILSKLLEEKGKKDE